MPFNPVFWRKNVVNPWQVKIKDGRQLSVRPVRPEDARDLYEAARHPDVARMIMLHPALELSATEEYINKEERGRHYLVAELEGHAVGSVTLDHLQRPRLMHMARLGLMVGRPHWRLGVGACLMQAALDIADNWLNLLRVELDVFTDNTAAINLYEKFGFETEGRRHRAAFGDGGWRDNLLMARLRNVQHLSPEPAPSEPAITRKDGGSGDKKPDSLVIRPPRREDAGDLHNLYRHPLVARTTLQIPSQEITLSRQRMESLPPGLYRLVAEVDGRVVGSISLHQAQHAQEKHAAGLGMGVHPDYWSQGIGSALMSAVIDLADNWLNITRVELDVNVDNPAGVHLYKKFGFEIEGTRRFHTYGDGRWADSYFMARLRD